MDRFGKWILLCSTLFCSMSNTHAQGSNELCQYSTGSGAIGSRVFIEDVREDLEPGAVITHLLVNGNEAQIRLWNAGTERHFRFDPASRNITVASSFVHTEAGYSLEIKCQVIDPPSSSQLTLRVKIHTLDLNTHAPQFINAPYYTNISELAPVGTTLISSISARDEDSSNPYVYYSVLPGPFSDHFEFPLPAQGKLVVKKMLDFEEVREIVLYIQAQDNHPNVANVPPVRLSSNTTVTVHVLDESDQNPAFNQTVYVATVTETDVMGTLILTDPPIAAYDPDLWQNTHLVYSIVPDPPNDESTHFSIDRMSGQLSLANSALQRGTKLGVMIQVTKQNSADRFSRALVRVRVQPANENAPRFLQAVYRARLVENTLIGSTVLRVQAVDNDQETELRYSFEEDYPEFQLNTVTGAIITAQELNFEEKENFTLRVTVTDGQLTDTARVEVTLVNTNNHNPVFTQSLYTFQASDVHKDEVLVQVEATDADRHSTVTFSFLDNASSRNFSIDERSGAITPLVDTSENNYLVVIAKDDGDPPRTATCFVQIRGSDPSPVRIESVKEKTESNTAVVIVLAVLIALLFIVVIGMAIYIFRRYALDDGTDFIPTTIDVHNCVSDCPYCRESNSSPNPPTVALISYMASKLKSHQGDQTALDKTTGHIHVRLQATQDPSQPKSRCVRSQSFEQNPMNFSSKNYKSYLDPVQAYQPNERHLQLYNGVTIEDATSTQENPFSSDDSLDRGGASANPSYTTGSSRQLPTHSAAVNAGLYPQQYPLDGATLGSSTDRRSGATLPGSHVPQVAHIDYDSAVSPMEMNAHKLNGFHGYNQHYSARDMQGSPRSSVNSEHSYNHGELTSFKVGSTTQLVPTTNSMPKSSRSLNKGSGNISFVDNSPSNSMYSSLTSQQSGLDPGPSEIHKPGITVYY